MQCEICFFNDTATTEIYTLSLHDALPILEDRQLGEPLHGHGAVPALVGPHHDGLPPAVRLVFHALQREALLVADGAEADRKSTRLNSSHANISYAVFCLKKKI